MANVKISDLPAATSVDPSDTFVMVQSGVTKQASQANILTTTGNVTAAKFFPTGTSATGTGMYSAAANTLAWSNNGAETMRLDSSGNLGIGTSSPGEKLHVNQGNIYTLRTGGAKLRLADQLNEVSFESLPVGSSSDAIWKTSSLERMRLDASGNLGIGTSSPSSFLSKLAVVGNITASDGGKLYQFDVTNSSGRYMQALPNSALSIGKYGSGGDVEQMVLDASGNLGIGTSSPATKLDVNGFVRIRGASQLQFFNADNTSGASIQNSGATSTDALTFNTTGSERMLLDSSGNLGLGATPSAWSGVVAMQLPTGAALTGFSNTTNLVQNAYYNGSWRYISTAAAALAQVTQGAHQWYTAPPGTAGNAISFTQAMTLDSSGNLGIGTSSPGATLDVVADANQLRIGTSDNKKKATFFYDNAANNLTFAVEDGYGVANIIWRNNAAERMRLDSSGNLGLGVTPSAWGSNFKAFESAGNASVAIAAANINGINIVSNGYADNTNWYYKTTGAVSCYSINSNVHQWFTAPSGTAGNVISFTQAMTLDAGGNLLVATTTTPSSSNAGFILAKDGNGTYLRNACTITSTRTHFEFVNGNGTVGSISTSASATAFNTSSDRRLKENIHPAGDAASVIDAIEVVQHDWKAGGHTRFGVIAQDLHAVAPEAVTPGDDGAEIEKTWGVDYSKLVPMLIKEIQSLRARVAALEA